MDMVMVMRVLNEWFWPTVVKVLYEEDRVDNAKPSCQVRLTPKSAVLFFSLCFTEWTHLKRQLISQEASDEIGQIP